MNYFYGRVQAVYGSKFKTQFRVDDEVDEVKLSKMEWAGQVMNLSKEDIDRGIEKLKQKMVTKEQDYLWVNIPLIAALCQPQPEDFGLPSVADAWSEVQKHSHNVDRHRWTHPAVRIAGRRTGWFDIMHLTSERGRDRLHKSFIRHYEYLVQRVMRGQEVKDAQMLLESDQQKQDDSIATRSNRYHDHKQLEDMEAQGINPAGGYEEFKKRMGL